MPLSRKSLQECSFLVVERRFAEKVRSPFERGAKLLRAPPPPDLLVTAGEEHLRHLESAKRTRPAVVRVVQQAVLEAVGCDAGGGLHDAGEIAGHGLEDRERRGFATGEDEIPERDLLVEKARVTRPLVDSLVAAADERDARPRGELPRATRVEPPALGRQEDHVRRGARLP